MGSEVRIKLEVSNVSKTFVSTNGNPVPAVRECSFVIEDSYVAGSDLGEFLCILGPSGCGKSTVLKMIAGLMQPDTGEIRLDGQLVSGPGRDRGMVFQSYTNFDWWTVRANVEYGLKLMGVKRGQRRWQSHEWVKRVGLSGFESAYPPTLSGGMRQRVAIARTLAVNPKVILMDEPFGALDAQTRSEMQQLLLELWRDAASTIVFVTHDIEEAVYLADRVLIMSPRPGTIVQDVKIPLARPRVPDMKMTPEFHDLEQRLLHYLKEAPGSGQVRVSV